MSTTYRVAVANFDQMHVHTNLQWVIDHPDTEVVALCDENPESSTGSLERAVEEHGFEEGLVYDDLDRCLEESEPDIVVGCPKNSEHADFVERVAEYDIHVTIEKPYALTMGDADRMLDAMPEDRYLAVNWPTTWDPAEHEVRDLVQNGTIGDVMEMHYVGGNAGAPPDDSWFYEADAGGGAMMDYLCYGATFTTWYRDGELPNTVTADAHVPEGEEVDTQASTIAHYGDGIASFQTTWQMFTHPWEQQPQPAKGVDIVGTEGTISTRDREDPIRVQTETDPGGYAVEPDPLPDHESDLISYLVHCIETDQPLEGPTDPAFCREAQRIIATAQESVDRGERLDLVE